jgi:hypothetical protein
VPLAQGAARAGMREHGRAIAMSRYTLEEWDIDPETTHEAGARPRLSMDGRV